MGSLKKIGLILLDGFVWKEARFVGKTREL
jgi:hypothetical protein